MDTSRWPLFTGPQALKSITDYIERTSSETMPGPAWEFLN